MPVVYLNGNAIPPVFGIILEYLRLPMPPMRAKVFYHKIT
jgi:hypothetical protein